MEWEEIKFEDFGKIVTGKTPPTLEKKYFNGSYQFISPKDMNFDSRYINTTITTITLEAINKFKNQVIPKNAVMYTCLSFGFGKIGLASSECLTNQQINSIIVDESKYDFNFVYYLLRNSKNYFLTFNSGIVTPIIPKSTFEKIKVFVPPLKTQKKIATILSNYDNLIENNNQRIKLLESMAEEIYKEWFVRLRFPEYEQVEIVDGIPVGWERKTLTEVGVFLNGYAFKPKDLLNNGLPIIKIKEMKQGIVHDTPRNGILNLDKKFLVKQGDILFSWSASLEVILWQDEDGWLNQHLFKVTPKNKISKHWLFLQLRELLETFNNLTTGATMKHIRRSELDVIHVNVPCSNIVEKFEQVINPIFHEAQTLQQKNKTLKETRDLLLPKLINGTLDVSEIA